MAELSVRDLRDLARSKPPFGVDKEALEALLDVAEAAHRANFNDPCGFCPPDADCANTRLNDALRRFDFDG